MIRPIDIRLNAAHPELPLAEAATFTGSPSTILIRGVPPNCGRWAITAVSVAATYPDGSTTTRAAVQSANGVWVATLPATATSGRTENGLRILADGIDENGAAVTGYILGVADLAVASLGVAPAPAPGETSWQMLYFDAVPGTLRKGDVAKVDGVLKLYNGSAWEPFAAPITFDDTVTSSSANGVKSSGIWAAIWGTASTAFSSLYDWCVAQLAGKASKADATLTERGPNHDGFSEWTILRDDVDVTEQVQQPYWEDDPDAAYVDEWVVLYTYVQGDFGESTITTAPRDAVALSWYGVSDGNVRHSYAATRTALQGYRLGPDDPSNPNRNKPLASEAEAEALRTGKQNALSAQQLANIAAVPSKANTSDIPYSLVTKTITNGAVSLDDRAINAVAVSSSLASLTVNFPTATSGKARDFGLRLTVASGITTAPELALPQGVVCENADGEAPEIGADGAATILYFTETASGVFLVKGEALQTITA